MNTNTGIAAIAIGLSVLMMGCGSICTAQESTLTSAERALMDIDTAVMAAGERPREYEGRYYAAARMITIAAYLLNRCVAPIGMIGWEIFLKEMLLTMGDLVLYLRAMEIPVPESVDQFFDLFRSEKAS